VFAVARKWEEAMTWRYLAITAVAVFSAAPALAQEMLGPCQGPQDACQELAKVPQGFSAAYNSKDAAAMARLFTQDAISVTDGPRIVFGRDAIGKDFEHAFNEGFSNLQATVAIRQIRGDVAWGGGDWSAMGPGPNNKMQSIHGHWSNFYVREDGGWKIRVAVNVGTARGF
jgi:uncharacterized protein (TIGR02246 family)